MSPTSISAIAIIVLILAPWANSSFARSQIRSHSSDQRSLPARPNCLSAIADFDGDRRLDQAELHIAYAHRCIRVRLGDSRETHLDVSNAPRTCALLLARDINHDNKPDLIWVSNTQFEPAMIWLGDGRGHFAEASNSADEVRELRTHIFGQTDPGIVGDSKDGQVYVTPNPVSSDVVRAAQLENEILKSLLSAGRNHRRDLGLYLSYLRERGPPFHSPV